MTSENLMLYHSSGSPNARRVRIFLAEKNLKIPLVTIDLGKGEQHSEAYQAINPRRGDEIILASRTMILHAINGKKRKL